MRYELYVNPRRVSLMNDTAVWHVFESAKMADTRRALVTEVNYRTLTVGAFFYVKHPHFDDNNLWIRERPQRKETIHFNSIVSIADGEWIGPSWRDSLAMH